MRFDNFGSLEQLPNDVERRNEKLHRVIGEKAGRGPWEVARVPVNANDNEQPYSTDICAPRLKPSDIRKLAAIQSLSFACSIEKDVCYAHHKIVN